MTGRAAALALTAPGALAAANLAGALDAADVQVATALGRLGGETDDRVLLAVGLAVAAVRDGSVCLDLRRAAPLVESPDATHPPAPDWPDPDDWLAACSASPLVAVGREAPDGRPLRLVGDLLYLDRYWQDEQTVRHELYRRGAEPPRPVDLDRLAELAGRLFPGDGPDRQRLAAAAAALGSLTVLAGGPGTGKTTTVARLVALVTALTDGPAPRVALAAPTGKASARLQQAVGLEHARLAAAGLPTPGALPASTLHRLLGVRPGAGSAPGGRFRHDRDHRLPQDLVVVDETSMVSLTLMARLLDALRPDARLVLVGDPDQLSSVQAGAVLGDVVNRPRRPEPPADPRVEVLERVLPGDLDAAGPSVRDELRVDVVRLTRVHRFGGVIADLADAIRRGDADAALAVLHSDADDVELVGLDERRAVVPPGLRADVVDAGSEMLRAAAAGDASAALQAVDRHRLLCGHRHGPYGVARWGRQVEEWLAAAHPGYGRPQPWYVGRPLLVTANDPAPVGGVRLYNGDTGVVIRHGGGGHDELRAAFGTPAAPLVLPLHRLGEVETVHAATVHRSQGSQFDRVTVIVPPEGSPLLTRELLYTAVTRARSFVRLVGTESALRRAVQTPVVRASGLREG